MSKGTKVFAMGDLTYNTWDKQDGTHGERWDKHTGMENDKGYCTGKFSLFCAHPGFRLLGAVF